MAKTLDERITSARSTDRITIKDLKALIAEVQQEETRQRAAHDIADAESVDLALSETDRDEAARLAGRAARLAKAYAEAAIELEAKLKAKIESEKRMAAEAERAAAIAQRNEIAERFKVIVPQAIAAITELFAQNEANAERMKKAGLRERTAEMVAREITGHHLPGGTPIAWYCEMKIPAWNGKGRAWPAARDSGDIDWAAAKKRAKLSVQEAAAKQEAQWGTYRARPTQGQDLVSFRVRVAPDLHAEKKIYLNRLWTGEMRHKEFERLRGLGVNVEAVDPAELASERAAREAAE